jgi:predicted phosphate transport protein (TIGR00153 family)
MQLIPRDQKFYEIFREQAETIHEAAKQLTALLENFEDVEKRVTEIKFLEHKGDQLIHSLVLKLNQTFITPFDREDIHALGAALDDVLDLIDGVAGRLITYKVTAVSAGARQLSRVILHGTEILLRAVSELQKPVNVLEYCQQLQQLEEDADHIKGECVARLFENTVDPIEVIKWKEIYEVLEATTDKVQDAADVLEIVIMKAT